MCWPAEATLQGQGRRAGVSRAQASRHVLTRPPRHRGPRPDRAQLHEALQLMRGNIRVLVRVRPGLPNPKPELERVGSDSVISFRMPGALTISPPERRVADFEFDTVLGPASTQARAAWPRPQALALSCHARLRRPPLRGARPCARAGRRVCGGRAAGALCAGRLQRVHFCLWPDGQARARAAPAGTSAVSPPWRARVPSSCGTPLTRGFADPLSGTRAAARRTRCRARLTTQVRARHLTPAAVLAVTPCHRVVAKTPRPGLCRAERARARDAVRGAASGGRRGAPRDDRCDAGGGWGRYAPLRASPAAQRPYRACAHTCTFIPRAGVQ